MSVVTESLLQLASSPQRLPTSTIVTPSLMTDKPLTPEKSTAIVNISNTETEVHVRALKFSSEATPNQGTEIPQKVFSVDKFKSIHY